MSNYEKQDHYNVGIQPIEVMKANMTKEEYKGFLKGNIEKYLWRKKGQDLEDYKKIAVYTKWLIEAEEEENGNS